ncbi:cbb3-type cytochrome oxidase assembly protein CcoS [Halomonas sp.]|uniref:cbb3-type cytochrome oxidase assembly protein CcoS n=1 Tax=Halomonas sp. TaxID=1486246 RepID=UPI0023541DE9|nr:cbb3-type cytochrome oxidase assembly protein CcoS [Halomonas sp.]
MSILYLLIPLSLILLGLAVWAFFWAVKNDQFEDLEGPAYRILFDDDANDIPPEQRRQDTTDGHDPPSERHAGNGDTGPADSPPGGVKH